MRRKPISNRMVALILVAIYIVGVILGIFVVSYLVSGAKRARLTAMTTVLAAQYQESGEADASVMSGRAVLVFSADGQLVERVESGGYPVHFDFEVEGRRHLDDVLEGKTPMKLVFFAPNDTTLGYTSLLYIGVPLTEEGEITAAFFWVMELRDLLETLLAVLCTFTGVFALMALFTLQNLRTQRRYEQLRRDYVDNITHELKTPIASIKALAEALSDGMEKSPADRNVYYGMILREANRQERMVCDALELSKLQSYRIQLKKEPLQAAQVFSPVLEKYFSLCDLMGITLTVDPSVDALPTLYTNEKYIYTVLDALLGNAVKFVPEEGEIRISAQISRRRAVITVADNGVGIAKEEIPHVFERFYKGHRSDNESGSGLGLAIAKEITDHMKETICIHSEENCGTRVSFTVTLD